MSDLSRPTDRELDGLLAGKPPAEDSQLEELAAFIHEVRACFAAEPPAGPVAAQHLAMIAETAALLAEGVDAEQGVARGSAAGQPVSRHHGWRRKPMFKYLLPALSGKAAASVVAGVLLVFGFSASAYAGVLPDPVQNAVSGFADNVGLPSVPSADPADAQTNDNNGDNNNIDQGQVGDDATQAGDNNGDNNNVDEGQVGDDATQANDNNGDNNNVDGGQVGEDATQANDNSGDNNNVDGGQVGGDTMQANDSNDQAPASLATPSRDQGGGNTSGGDQDGQGDQGN